MRGGLYSFSLFLGFKIAFFMINTYLIETLDFEEEMDNPCMIAISYKEHMQEEWPDWMINVK